jgi:hypothetical protein
MNSSIFFKNKNSLLTWGSLYFAILIIYAIVFYKERVAFTDAAGTLIGLCQRHKCLIQLDRYGAFITQLLPLIFLYFGGSLKAIAIAYSVNFIVFHALVFVVLFKCQQYNLAIAWLLFFCLMMGDAFFYVHNELFTAQGFMLLSIGLFQYSLQFKSNFNLLSFISFICLTLGMFSHLSAVLVFGFIMVFYFFYYKLWQYAKSHFWVAFAILIVLISKYISTTHSWYDVSKLEAFENKTALHNIFNYKSTQLFLATFFKEHILVVLFLIYSSILLLYVKKYFFALINLLSVLAYLIITLILFSESAPLYYMQGEWMPISIITVIIFFNCINVNEIQMQLIIPIAVIFSLVHIYIKSSFYTHYTSYKYNIIEKMHLNNDVKKYCNNYSQDTLPNVHLWTLGNETIILSSLNNCNNTCTFFYTHNQTVLDSINNNNTLIGLDFLYYPDSVLNKKYFNLSRSKYIAQ